MLFHIKNVVKFWPQESPVERIFITKSNGSRREEHGKSGTLRTPEETPRKKGESKLIFSHTS